MGREWLGRCRWDWRVRRDDLSRVGATLGETGVRGALCDPWVCRFLIGLAVEPILYPGPTVAHDHKEGRRDEGAPPECVTIVG